MDGFFPSNFSWALRRWTPAHIFYRLRLPIRRRRWARERLSATRSFVKNNAIQQTRGPALVFGEFSGNHGLGRAAAYDFELIRSKHDKVLQLDIGPYLKGEGTILPMINERIENVYFLCQPDTYGTICKIIRPEDIARTYRVGRWVWETPMFPEDWRPALDLIHEIWTPSEFCADVFSAATTLPVRVVPHAVVPPARSQFNMRERYGIGESTFMGLSIMDIRSCPARKNPWEHVRAWKNAFGDDPSAILVMKIRVGKRTRVVLDELRELIGSSTNVRLLINDLSNEDIAALHHAADVFVSLHRSEGFGLNIYEALLSDKFVVATDWSANSEYGPRFPKYYGVPFRLDPYHDWTGHYADRDFKWATAIGAAEILREVRDKWANRLPAAVRTRFLAETSPSSKIQERLDP
jgi:glycosyltransferase involved in cell wall biosynthesis